VSSINEQLERVRKPRVHIKYEVETEDGVVEKELPFVVGVMGDFSGDSIQPLKPLKERKFTKIDRDNFSDVMRRMTPGLKLKVDNTLEGDGQEMSVDLKFESIEDFNPEKIVEQVPALKKLLDARNKLRDLLTKTDRSDELEKILEKALQDKTTLQNMATQLCLTEQQ